MANAWMSHVKVVRKQHPKKSLKEVLKMAAKTYKKSSTNSKRGKTVKNGKKGKKGKKGKTMKRGRKSRGRK